MADEQHPTDWKDIAPEWQQDLHPDASPGQEQGAREPQPGKSGLTAEAIKALQ